MIGTTRKRAIQLAAICATTTLLSVAGCQDAAADGSLDSATQSLLQFVGDFARQVLAAYFL